MNMRGNTRDKETATDEKHASILRIFRRLPILFSLVVPVPLSQSGMETQHFFITFRLSYKRSNFHLQINRGLIIYMYLVSVNDFPNLAST